MPEFDTIIRGGTIVDGTRMPRFRADIGIVRMLPRTGKSIRRPDGDCHSSLSNGLSSADTFCSWTAASVITSSGASTARA